MDLHQNARSCPASRAVLVERVRKLSNNSSFRRLCLCGDDVPALGHDSLRQRCRHCGARDATANGTCGRPSASSTLRTSAVSRGYKPEHLQRIACGFCRIVQSSEGSSLPAGV